MTCNMRQINECTVQSNRLILTHVQWRTDSVLFGYNARQFAFWPTIVVYRINLMSMSSALKFSVNLNWHPRRSYAVKPASKILGRCWDPVPPVNILLESPYSKTHTVHSGQYLRMISPKTRATPSWRHEPICLVITQYIITVPCYVYPMVWSKQYCTSTVGKMSSTNFGFVEFR